MNIDQKAAFPPLQAQQIFLAGVRDLDPPEAEYVAQRGIEIVTCEELTKSGGKCLLNLLAKQGFNRCYIHIDPDVLHLDDFNCTSCPTPDGIRLEVLTKAVSELRSNLDVIGGSLQEVTGAIERESAMKDGLCKLFADLSGYSKYH